MDRKRSINFLDRIREKMNAWEGAQVGKEICHSHNILMGLPFRLGSGDRCPHLENPIKTLRPPCLCTWMRWRKFTIKMFLLLFMKKKIYIILRYSITIIRDPMNFNFSRWLSIRLSSSVGYTPCSNGLSRAQIPWSISISKGTLVRINTRNCRGTSTWLCRFGRSFRLGIPYDIIAGLVRSQTWLNCLKAMADNSHLWSRHEQWLVGARQ